MIQSIERFDYWIRFYVWSLFSLLDGKMGTWAPWDTRDWISIMGSWTKEKIISCADNAKCILAVRGWINVSTVRTVEANCIFRWHWIFRSIERTRCLRLELYYPSTRFSDDYFCNAIPEIIQIEFFWTRHQIDLLLLLLGLVGCETKHEIKFKL